MGGIVLIVGYCWNKYWMGGYGCVDYCMEKNVVIKIKVIRSKCICSLCWYY